VPEHKHYNRYDQTMHTHDHLRGGEPHYHEIDTIFPDAIGAAVYHSVPCPNCGSRLVEQASLMGPNYFACQRCKEEGEVCYQWERPGA
jgi:hypothetical protein